MNTKNHAWGKRFYDKLCSQEFSWICSIDVTQRSNQLMYSLCFPVRYYDSGDIKFDTVVKIQLKKFE